MSLYLTPPFEGFFQHKQVFSAFTFLILVVSVLACPDRVSTKHLKQTAHTFHFTWINTETTGNADYLNIKFPPVFSSGLRTYLCEKAGRELRRVHVRMN